MGEKVGGEGKIFFCSFSLLMELGVQTWVLEGILEVQVLGLRGALESIWQLIRKS